MASNLKKNIIAIAALFIGVGAGALSAFLLQIFFTHFLSVTDYGIFSAGYSIALLISPVAGMGLGQFILRTFGEEGQAASRWLGIAKSYIIISSSLTFFLIFLIVYGWTENLLQSFAMACLTFPVIALELVSVQQQLVGNYKGLALWQAFPHVARLVFMIGIYVFFSYLSLKLSLLGVIFSSILVFGVAAIKLKSVFQGEINLREFGFVTQKVSASQPNLFGLAKVAFPFGITSLLFLSYFQASVPYAAHYLGAESAALTSVCITILTAVYLVPAVIFQKFLSPTISYRIYNDVFSLYKLYCRSLVIMGLVGLIAALMLYTVSDWLVPKMFGEQYTDAVSLLQVMVFAIPARFAGASCGAFMVRQDMVHRKVFSLLVVVLFNFLFIKLMHECIGFHTVAYSLVASEVILALLLLIFSRRF
ncbi:MATE family efflux transporter [Stutzerimonas chloritidismutans]|uniref:hypothetical protein n=1 Tax=Stutzerimonas chloritidismutans TaxID=203192 RepID=UPI003F17C3EE